MNREYPRAKPAMVMAVCLLSLAVRPAFGAVLPPAAGERLGAAFEQLEPAWELESAAVAESEVDATLCGEEGCFEIRLTEPGEDCGEVALPAWCIHGLGQVPASLETALRKEFGSHDFRDFWRVPKRNTGGQGLPDEEPDGPWSAYLLALAMLLVPVLSGALVGLAIRRLRGRRLAGLPVGLAMVLLPLVPPFVMPYAWLVLGVYDLLLVGLGLAVGLVWTGHRWCARLTWRDGLLVVGSLVVALVLAEVGAWYLLPTPPAFPPPESASLRLLPAGTADAGAAACKALFPERFPELVQSRQRFPERPRQVLHVGDSMVEGVGVQPDERFVSLLNARQESIGHTNAGFSGTGPAHYLATTRRWLALQDAHLVVWYLFPFNDFDSGLKARYGCCGGEALLVFDGDQVKDNCPEWDESKPESRFRRSPPLYPLRVATAWSRLAAHLTALHVGLVRGRGPVVEFAAGLERTGLVLSTAAREIGATGGRFVVVVVPYRGLLEGAWNAPVLAERRDAVFGLCRSLDVTCLDGSIPFGGPDEGEVTPGLFIDEPVWDYHFSASGHELFAEWLQDVLPLDFSAPQAAQPPIRRRDAWLPE